MKIKSTGLKRRCVSLRPQNEVPVSRLLGQGQCQCQQVKYVMYQIILLDYAQGQCQGHTMSNFNNIFFYRF